MTATIDYSKYNVSKLQYALNSTRRQIAKFEDAMCKADKQLKDFAKKHAEYIAKEALIRKELTLKLPIPNETTKEALDNAIPIARGLSHKEFRESLKNEAD